MFTTIRLLAASTLVFLSTAALPPGFALADVPAAPSAAPATPIPAPSTTSPAPVPDSPARLFIRDGQLLSHPLPVFVTQQIDDTMHPVLRFRGAHLVTNPGALEREPLNPLLVAPHQIRTITIAGAEVQTEGTLLVFDLAVQDVAFYKSAVRLLPSVEWTVPAPSSEQRTAKRQVVSEDDIYLGNLGGALLWTFVIVAFVLSLLVAWSYSKRKQVTGFTPIPALLLITGPDGYLSLWRTQLLLWTIAVGSLVFLFGLVQLHVPEIPDTLVALMGMSLLTGLVAKRGQAPSPAAAAPLRNARPHFGDLIATWNQDTGQLEFSLPKAQMVFWTVLILVLFCIKSILGGALWSVPWQMVALTGFSQTGYIGDKFVTAKQ